MIWLKLAMAILLPTILGYLLIILMCRGERKLSWSEHLALGWGLGIGLLGLFGFALALLGLKLSWLILSPPLLIITTILLVYVFLRRYPVFWHDQELELFCPPKLPQKNLEQWGSSVLTVLLMICLIFVFFDALVKPIVNFDDLWRQGAIAKIIFTTGQVLTEQGKELAGPHPYLNPLSQAWIYFNLGEWNDALGKVVFPLFFAGLLTIFYANLKKLGITSFYALFFTFLITTFPLIVYHAGTAYSDLMQTFYFSAGAIYLFLWLDRREDFALYVAAGLFGIGTFVKQLGIPLWLIAVFVLFFALLTTNKREKSLSPGWTFMLISGLIALPWLANPANFLFSQASGLINKLISSENALASVGSNSPYGPPTLSSIFFHLGKRMFTYADWQLLWFVLILSLVLFWQRIWSSSLKYLLLMIFLALIMIIYGFTDQSAYNFLVDGTLVQRMVMWLTPVTLFFCARCFIKPSAKKN